MSDATVLLLLHWGGNIINEGRTIRYDKPPSTFVPISRLIDFNSLESIIYQNIGINNQRHRLKIFTKYLTLNSLSIENDVLLLLQGDATVQLLRNVHDVIKYSWGSAVLGLLYRELCNASQAGKQQISGPLQLLQIWAWTRFRCLTPYQKRCRVDTNPICVNDNMELPCTPLAAWWKCKLRFTETSNHSLRIFRDMLDRLAQDEFIWESYDHEHPCMTNIIVWGFNDVCRARVPLILFHIVEMYRPDRVMRQFGMRQSIPEDAQTIQSLHLIDRRGHQGTNWMTYHEQYVRDWMSRQWVVQHGELRYGSLPPDEHYVEWYEKITRKIISRSNQPLNAEPSGYRVEDYSQLELVWQKLGEIKLHADEGVSSGDDLEVLKSSMLKIQEAVSSIYNSDVHLPTQHSRHNLEQQHRPNNDQVVQHKSSRRRIRRRRDTREELYDMTDCGPQQFGSSSEVSIDIGVHSNYASFPSTLPPNVFGTAPRGYESMIDSSTGCYLPIPYNQNEQPLMTPFNQSMSYIGLLQSSDMSAFMPFQPFGPPSRPSRHFESIPYGTVFSSLATVQDTTGIQAHEGHVKTYARRPSSTEKTKT